MKSFIYQYPLKIFLNFLRLTLLISVSPSSDEYTLDAVPTVVLLLFTTFLYQKMGILESPVSGSLDLRGSLS
ncbi:hypothetical protein ES332_A05G137400v1 [Gossypium tomentosum]|uniref:Uncharacterized protein n=1 Tax=Gossypium tomentosum TaxID=34277 RepID=A0A5D2QHZ5_GOSTO|nr:hypothetical protein ES332_A05G137400v1 [Gossypium tomentosum]